MCFILFCRPDSQSVSERTVDLNCGRFAGRRKNDMSVDLFVYYLIYIYCVRNSVCVASVLDEIKHRERQDESPW